MARRAADPRAWLQNLYQTLPHHNYGWWLTTRDHHDVATLVTAVQFLYSRFGSRQISLSNSDYNNLQHALGRTVPRDGARQVLNRHVLLNMWRPLRLLERERTNRINPFWLSERGLELAHTSEPRRSLESILREIRFVHPDWTRPGVSTQYSGISVHPHRVLNAVLEGIGGYLTRNEYRLFVARMTLDDARSVNQAVTLISEFRVLSQGIQEQLIQLERPLFPTPKSYQDWVDMDLHAFSLFATGTTFRRIDTVLVLAGTEVDAAVTNTFVIPQGVTPTRAAIVPRPGTVSQRVVELRAPTPDVSLETPPSPTIEANSGQEAEGFVARLLEANGFEVRDFSRFRGYGFDLWAQHRETGSVYYCEVKSSTSTLSNAEFTRLEVEAAEKYGDRYVLFCVENLDSSEGTGDIWAIQNPWGEIPSLQTPRTTTVHRARRSEWRRTARRL